MKTRIKRLFACDSVRVSRFPDRMFLIIGWNRSTRDDKTRHWIKNGEPFHFEYLKEKVIASGKNEKELIAGALRYNKLRTMDPLEALQEILR